MRDLATANKVMLKLPDSLIAARNRRIYCLHLYFYAVFCNTIWFFFLLYWKSNKQHMGMYTFCIVGESVRRHHLRLALNPVDRETMHGRNNFHRHPRWRQLGLLFGKALYQLRRRKILDDRHCKIGSVFVPSSFLSPIFCPPLPSKDLVAS